MPAPIGDPDDFSLVRPSAPKPLATAKRDRYHPEVVRANLVYVLVLALVALIAFLALMAGVDRFDQVREISEIALPALVGLAGTAVGFYFRDLLERD